MSMLHVSYSFKHRDNRFKIKKIPITLDTLGTLGTLDTLDTFIWLFHFRYRYKLLKSVCTQNSYTLKQSDYYCCGCVGGHFGFKNGSFGFDVHLCRTNDIHLMSDAFFNRFNFKRGKIYICKLFKGHWI